MYIFSSEKANGNTMHYVINNGVYIFTGKVEVTRGFIEKVENLFLSF